MITIKTIPNECKTDHLFLLVGANPLPNFVAALLLRKPNSTFHLLHSQETLLFAENLRDGILAHHDDHKFKLLQIDATDSETIRHVIEQQMALISPRASVGLNYTGGTKTMSVHAYRIVETKRSDAILTYLDARTLSLHIEGHSGEPMRRIDVTYQSKVDLNTLVQLHGYAGIVPKDELVNDAHQTIVSALLQIHMQKAGCEAWRQYASESKFGYLPDLEKYPLLTPFIEAAVQICGQQPTLEALAKALGSYPKFSSYAKWLIGGWLEEHVYIHLQSIASKVKITDVAYGVQPSGKAKSGEKRIFDLDVAAIRGYQLFAISCRAAYGKGESKEHLLEVYVRARQLGGDEARIALVCFYDKPDRLQDEIEEAWFADNRIRVFGRDQLLTLSDHLHNWISTANQ